MDIQEATEVVSAGSSDLNVIFVVAGRLEAHELKQHLSTSRQLPEFLVILEEIIFDSLDGGCRSHKRQLMASTEYRL